MVLLGNIMLHPLIFSAGMGLEGVCRFWVCILVLTGFCTWYHEIMNNKRLHSSTNKYTPFYPQLRLEHFHS